MLSIPLNKELTCELQNLWIKKEELLIQMSRMIYKNE